jgi:hypothetical protein
MAGHSWLTARLTVKTGITGVKFRFSTSAGLQPTAAQTIDQLREYGSLPRSEWVRRQAGSLEDLTGWAHGLGWTVLTAAALWVAMAVYLQTQRAT